MGNTHRLKTLFLANAAVLITHEIDSAYWREWELLRIPGGIQVFALLNLILVIAVLYGFKALIEERAVGLVFSWLLAASGFLAVGIHGYFLLGGDSAFTLATSIGLLCATGLLSAAQVLNLVRVRSEAWRQFAHRHVDFE